MQIIYLFMFNISNMILHIFTYAPSLDYYLFDLLKFYLTCYIFIVIRAIYFKGDTNGKLVEILLSFIMLQSLTAQISSRDIVSARCSLIRIYIVSCALFVSN